MVRYKEVGFSASGFTLLELVTVMAIIGILLVMSCPVYQHYALKARRAQAAMALLDLAASLEEYHSVQQTYVGATLQNLAVNAYTDSQNYQLLLSDLTEDSYQLQAIPQGSQTSDTLCGRLGLNALGEKSSDGTGQVADCW